MSDSLRIILFVFLGLLAVNVLISALQIREAKDREAPKTSLYLWLITLCVFVISGILSEQITPLTSAGYGLGFIQTLLVARFAHLTMGSDYRPALYTKLFAVAVAVFVILALAGAPFWAYTLPLGFGISLPLVQGFLSALRKIGWKKLSLPGRLYLLNALVFALHEFDFAFLRPHVGTTIFGASLMLAILHIFSVLMPTLAHESRSRAYEEELKREVDHRTQMLLSSSKMAALGEMAGGIAHEINSPLTIITHSVSYLKQILKEPEVNREKLEKRLQTISDTAWRIAKIISGLRTFSRDSQLDPSEPTEIRKIVEDTLGLCSEKFRLNGIELTVQPFDPELKVNCRSVQISEVLLNLLNNAYDAVREQSEKWVQIRVQRLPSFIEVSVANSGPPIPPAVREKLFQPFFTTKPVGQGTGLGLSVSVGIVQAHGGRIWLKSDTPHTEFAFSLPV